MVSGFLSCFELKLSLAELRSATSGLEAVLLTLFHSWVAGQQTCFFEQWAHFIAVLQQSTGDTVTDRTSLTGNAAAANGADNVKFTSSVGNFKWLTNDQFEGIQTEVLVNVSVVDGNFTGTWVQSYSCLLYTSRCV